MKIVIVNGFPMSGKTTFENYCLSLRPHTTKILSTVDPIKTAAKEYFYWTGAKTPEDRKFLSDLKDLTSRYNHTPTRYCVEQVQLFKNDLEYYGVLDKGLVFIDAREPESIAELKEALKEFNPIALLIQRAGINQDGQINNSDKNVLNYNYDYYILNNGSIEELQAEAYCFLVDKLGLK